MIANCSCPHCGQHIEFEIEDVGTVAPCPTCGKEFTLTAPVVVPPEARGKKPPGVFTVAGTGTPTTERTPNKGLVEETTFYQSGEITVTNARFIVGPQTFAVRGITSVQGVQTPAKYGGAALVLFLGVVLAMSTAFRILGVFLLAAGVWIWFLQKPKFAVVLRTAGGEVTAYESKNRDDISPIIQALNNAIISSG